jgi:WbqC-like protein family
VIVAIHQPNFFPWLGYFNKMAIADTFVVLDHVEGFWRSSWLTRNRVLGAEKPQWLSLPVDRSDHRPVPATRVRVQWENRLVGQNLRVIEARYAEHPFFDEVFDLVHRAYASRREYIADVNLSVIEEIRRRLGLEPEFVRSSELLITHPELRGLQGNDLLVAICQAVGGHDYLSGAGSLGYVDPLAFESAGIDFWFQRYAHPEYPQRGTRAFVSHLSVLDALFNVGFDSAGGLVVGDARERMTALEKG